jgi:hypothetical protein
MHEKHQAGIRKILTDEVRRAINVRIVVVKKQKRLFFATCDIVSRKRDFAKD